MPEWGTQPANHYLPRRRTGCGVSEEEVARRDGPLASDGRVPGTLAALIAEAEATASGGR
jgi:hypothetical protein